MALEKTPYQQHADFLAKQQRPVGFGAKVRLLLLVLWVLPYIGGLLFSEHHEKRTLLAIT